MKVFSLFAGAGAVGFLFIGSPVLAQVSQPPAAAESEAVAQETVPDEEIVVTGTLLRGIAPTGTNVVALSAEDIGQTGAINANQLLARIPQVASAFGQVPALSGNDPGNSIVRPNLRNLGAAGGSTTLVLVDGHRQVDAGILITAPDPDVIPPAVLERVDVVPDGGSSIYGSDAVGGVINFITRQRFDGFQADARYGFGRDYHTFDTNLTAGTDWGSGSAYISFNYAENGLILGRDRGYATQRAAQTGLCSPGTVQVTVGGTTTSYALPGRVPGTVAQCDNIDESSVLPEVQRISTFGSLVQELGSGIDLSVKAFHTRRETTSSSDLNRNGQSGTITAANPFYVPIGPNDPGTQTVSFGYATVATPRIGNVLDEWGVTPTISADLGASWGLRVLGNVQQSTVTQTQTQFDAVAQANALAATTPSAALNPYDLTATSPSVLNGIAISERQRGRQNLINGRAIVDGTPFTLLGNEVRLAVGVEFIRQELANSIQGTFVGSSDVSRDVKSIFGEIALPIFAGQNARGGFQALTLSASARYDDYSDFGDTFNPKLGFTWRPMDILTIRGNWGKSFNAPSLADTFGAPDTRAILFPFAPFPDPADPISVGSRPSLLIAGGNGALQPQKADTWSLGAELTPADGLVLSGTYYNIRLRDQIGIIPIFGGNPYVPAYSAYVIKEPTLAQAQALIGDLPLVGGESLEAFFAAANGRPYVLLDARRQNLGLLHQDGLDFNASYTMPTSFGTVDARVGGTYTLNRDLAGAVGQPFIEQLETPGESRFSLLASLGVESGGFSGTATWTHRAGYDANPNIGTQDRVDGFDTIDLFLGYEVEGTGLLSDLSFTLTAINLFDQDPPFYNLDPGYINGSTPGRVVQLGVSKRF